MIYLSTFSKTIAPGLRVGWLVAPDEVFRMALIAKQAADLHTSGLDQRIVHRYLRDNETEEHIALIRRAYGERYGVMDRALRAGMPEGFAWTHPEGGMFLWVTCPPSTDTNALLETAIRRKVMFVPGRDFFPRRQRPSLHAFELFQLHPGEDRGRDREAGGDVLTPPTPIHRPAQIRHLPDLHPARGTRLAHAPAVQDPHVPARAAVTVSPRYPGLQRRPSISGLP